MTRHYGKVLVGLELIEDSLRVEDFPMTREDLDYAIGDVEVEDAQGRFVAVRRVLDVVPQREFATCDEVVSAIKQYVDQTAHHHSHKRGESAA